VHEQLQQLPRLLTAHLGLSLFSLLVGVCISVPLGVLASRRSGLGHVLLSGASIVQTIPSLALLALMVPLLGSIGLANIGFLPAFIALVLYTVLPVLRNTVTGLTNLPPAVIEAARGVGMDRWQQLGRIELPLALPVIVAGIRTASVWTVGAATLATPVGADSLGNFIFSGLQTRNVNAVLLGCLAAAALALGLDGLGKLLLWGIERRSRTIVATALAVFIGLYAYAGGALALGARAPAGVVVGSKTFTEQYVLAALLAGRIQREARLPVQLKPSLGSSVIFDALTAGSIDVYVDYSGTIWSTLMKKTGTPPGRQAVLAEVDAYLAREHGVSVVARLGFENSYALAMRRQDAERAGIEKIGDLAGLASTLAIGGDYEFFARPEWRSILQTYGLTFREQRSMDPSLMYQAVASGAVDVIGAFSTDGRIAANDLVVLEDERGAIPPYDAILLAGRGVVARHPEAIAALRSLDGAISAEQMRRMNLAVDIDGQSPEAVARAFEAARAQLRGDALP
jgi:osmoprotectant transport system permease protein